MSVVTTARIESSTINDLEEHKRAVECYSLKAHDGRVFIQTEKLKAWFTDDSGRLGRLLSSAHPGVSSPSLPLRSIELHPPHSFILVFSILLKIELGHCIDRFKFKDLHDERLPFQANEIRDILRDAPQLAHKDNDAIEKYTQRIFQDQYAYCPAYFDYPHRRTYDAAVVLPILRKEIVSRKGMTAAIWQIVVPEEFLTQSLKDKLQQSRFESDIGIGTLYHLAMKVFHTKMRMFYDTERNAFNSLFDHEGMLRCFGHFDQPDDSGQDWHHILLEYGQLDLDEYFFERPRPIFPDQIAGFWEKICGVVDAVSKLHKFESPREDSSDVYYGCHADIKPDNILLVRGVFKLADPGLASFIKQEVEQKLRKRGEKVFVRGGTVTYGAPECHLGELSGGEVTNKIDIWSLGCVLSLAATWVLLDIFGLYDYEYFRQQALHQLFVANNQELPVTEENQSRPHPDWFHDGKEALVAVRQWHDYLRLASAPMDSLTSNILSLVDKAMLCKEVDRWGAQRIRAEITNEIRMYRDRYQAAALPTSTKLPDPIKDFMLAKPWNLMKAIDQNEINVETGRPRTLEDDETNPRKVRKSERLQHTRMLISPTSTGTSSTRTVEITRDEPTSSGSVIEIDPSMHTKPDPVPGTHATTSDTSPQTAPKDSFLSERTSSSSGIVVPTGLKTMFDFAQQPQGRPRRLTRLFTTKKLQRLKDKDKELAQYFVERDIHFLVDNGLSMMQVWKNTSELLSSLVKFACGQDPDGMDLSFTHGDWRLRKCEDPASFAAKMKEAAPNQKISIGTDIRVGLNKILRPYLKKTPGVRDLVIVILTDGKWEGMRDPMSIQDTLVTFYKDLTKMMPTSIEKQVGFGFVQMGEDQEAFRRLHLLDKYLAKQYSIPDMIDVTPWNKDIRKMLLGSFNEAWDDMGEDAIDIQPDSDPGEIVESPQSTSPTLARRPRLASNNSR